MTFALTRKELYLAVMIALMGYFLYSSSAIIWLSKLTIFQGWLLYNVLYIISIYTLSKMGLTIFGMRITTLSQTLGLYLITTAFYMTINWESAYVNLVTKGTSEGVSEVYWQTDDGLSWYSVNKYIPNLELEQARIIAFVVIPFILALIGGYLLTGRIRI